MNSLSAKGTMKMIKKEEYYEDTEEIKRDLLRLVELSEKNSISEPHLAQLGPLETILEIEKINKTIRVLKEGYKNVEATL